MLADCARDAGEWERAARLYRDALDQDPRNPPIWVQYGHSLKESGGVQNPDKLAQAEIAYRRALSLDPSAADPHLQLGHVLKLQGKTNEAEAAYLRAFALDRSMPHPLQELSALGWSEAQTSELRGMLGTDTAGPLEINALAHYLWWGAPNGRAPPPAGDGALVEAKLQLRERASRGLNAFLEEGDLLRFPAAVEPAVSILLELYNQAQLTFRCLWALIETVDLPAEVIIIENASSDSTWRLLDRLAGARIMVNVYDRHLGHVGVSASQTWPQPLRQGRVGVFRPDFQKIVLPTSLVVFVKSDVERTAQIRVRMVATPPTAHRLPSKVLYVADTRCSVF
jgi:hypothetical protein